MILTILWLFWITQTVNCTLRSIGFSETSLTNQSSTSYWYGHYRNKQLRFILDLGLTLNFQITKPTGLLLYLIDSYYRNIWIELKNDKMTVNYYNFIEDHVVSTVISINSRCQKFRKLSLMVISNELIILCDSIKTTMHYEIKTSLVNFLKQKPKFENFFLPVPKDPLLGAFNFITHLWIGNIGYNVEIKNPNAELRKYDHMFGCIFNVYIGNIFDSLGLIIFNMIKIGDPAGSLAESNCNTICQKNTCSSGKCIEKWRQKYSCDCWETKYLGSTNCNVSYCKMFRGKSTIDINLDSVIKQMKFVFLSKSVNNHVKMISLLFKENWYIHLYIDYNSHLKVMVEMIDTKVIELYKIVELTIYEYYVVLIEFKKDLLLTILNTYHEKVIEEIIYLDHSLDLTVRTVSVGGAESVHLRNFFKFIGKFSNLIIWHSENEQFIWNEHPQYSLLQDCITYINITENTNFIRENYSELTLIMLSGIILFAVTIILIIMLIRFQIFQILINERKMKVNRSTSTSEFDVAENYNIRHIDRDVLCQKLIAYRASKFKEN